MWQTVGSRQKISNLGNASLYRVADRWLEASAIKNARAMEKSLNQLLYPARDYVKDFPKFLSHIKILFMDFNALVTNSDLEALDLDETESQTWATGWVDYGHTQEPKGVKTFNVYIGGNAEIQFNVEMRSFIKTLIRESRAFIVDQKGFESAVQAIFNSKKALDLFASLVYGRMKDMKRRGWLSELIESDDSLDYKFREALEADFGVALASHSYTTSMLTKEVVTHLKVKPTSKGVSVDISFDFGFDPDIFEQDDDYTRGWERLD